MGRWLVVGVLAGIGLLVLLLRRRYAVVVVDGESMLPTLHPGQRLLIRRLPPTMIRTGQIVVLGDRLGGRRQAALVVKRISALPGEPVPAPFTVAGTPDGGQIVPDGMVAVLGDNAAASLDSRQCGYVDQNRIRGVVLRPLPVETRERR